MDDIDKTILTGIGLGILFAFAYLITYCAVSEWMSGDIVSASLFYITDFIFIGMIFGYFTTEIL